MMDDKSTVIAIQPSFSNTSPRTSAITTPPQLKSQVSPFQLPHARSIDIEHLAEKSHSDNRIKLAMIVLFSVTVTASVFFRIDQFGVTAVIMSVFFGQWIFFSLYELYVADTISAVWVFNRRLQGFGTCTFPYTINQKYDLPMGSLSEFCGTRGSSLNHSMLVMSIGASTSFINILILRMNEIVDNSNDGNMTPIQIIGFLSGFINAIGIAFVGVFELNGHSKFSQNMHYLGVGSMVVGFVLFGILDLHWLHWIVASIAFLGGISYFIYLFIYVIEKKYPKNRKTVHSISVTAITLEIIFLFFGAVCDVIVVYHLPKL